MTINRGKAFESRFRLQWQETVPDSFIYRLNDQVSGYKGTSRNVSDFICYKKPIIYLIECKSHEGNTFPLATLRQYDELIQYDDIPGVEPGVILWMVDHDKVLWIPISTFKRLKDENKKSFNIKMINEYKCLELPSKKLRTFMSTNYSALIDYYKEK